MNSRLPPFGRNALPLSGKLLYLLTGWMEQRSMSSCPITLYRKMCDGMNDRYVIQLEESQIAVTDSPQEAEERALRGEGNPGDSQAEEPRIKCGEAGQVK